MTSFMNLNGRESSTLFTYIYLFFFVGTGGISFIVLSDDIRLRALDTYS